MPEKKWHDVDDDAIETLEMLQYNSFVDGWIAAVGPVEDVPVLEHRINASEKYNELHGTDHMGEMLRRIQAREASAS